MNKAYILDAIHKVVGRFEDEDGSVSLYRESDVSTEDNSIQLEIGTEVETLLDGLGVKNSVEVISIFDSPGLDTYALCVAYVLDGELYTYNCPVYC